MTDLTALKRETDRLLELAAAVTAGQGEGLICVRAGTTLEVRCSSVEVAEAMYAYLRACNIPDITALATALQRCVAENEALREALKRYAGTYGYCPECEREDDRHGPDEPQPHYAGCVLERLLLGAPTAEEPRSKSASEDDIELDSPTWGPTHPVRRAADPQTAEEPK